MKSVIGVVFSPDYQHILLILRRDVDIWVLPGGGIDPGESPVDAITREIKEESGLVTDPIRLVAEYTPVNRLAKPTYLYESKVVGGQLTTGEETRSLQFFPLASLPLNFFKIHRDFLNDALAQHDAPIHKKLTQVNYWEVLKFFSKHPITVLRYVFTFLGMPLNK